MPMTAPKQGLERMGRGLKLRDLRILMTVVECGTMGKAAARLAVSQPVVSKAIADLEHALGVRLLDRSRRGVEPTPYGRALTKRGVAIFDEMDRISVRSHGGRTCVPRERAPRYRARGA